VWSLDKYSSDTFLGQVIISLSSLTSGVTLKQWYPLESRTDEKSRTEEKSRIEEKIKGKLLLELLLTVDTVRTKISFADVELNLPFRTNFTEC